MKKTEIDEVLDFLMKDFENNYIVAELDTVEDEILGEAKAIYPLFNMMGEDEENVYGEFGFLPLQMGAEENTQYFSLALEILKDMSKELADKLKPVVEKINFFTPGAFLAFSPDDKILSLRSVVMIPNDFTSELAFKSIKCAIDNMEIVTENIICDFRRVASGKADIDSFRL